MNETRAFYDDLADDYHLIFQDWEESRTRQAGVLNRLIKDLSGPEASTILDCACGIGTQALGLAELGYRVTATDLSPRAVEETRIRATSLGLEMRYGVADFRTLSDQVDGEFEVVLASGNALPHLHTEKEIQSAAKQLLLKTKPGGLLIISIRDYDELLEAPPRVTPVRVFDSGKERRVNFQVWDWILEEERYNFQLFIIQSGSEGTWHTRVYESSLKAWRREPLARIFEDVGFLEVAWRMPAETDHHSPILTGIRRP